MINFKYHVEIMHFMLKEEETKKLNQRDTLSPKARANLDYRIAQKIKKRLSELDEINTILEMIPEKNARRVLNDEMVADILKLTENILKLLRYNAPIVNVKRRPSEIEYVVRSEEVTSEKDGKRVIKRVEERATVNDKVRQAILQNHIKELQSFTESQAVDIAKDPEALEQYYKLQRRTWL